MIRIQSHPENIFQWDYIPLGHHKETQEREEHPDSLIQFSNNEETIAGIPILETCKEGCKRVNPRLFSTCHNNPGYEERCPTYKARVNQGAITP